MFARENDVFCKRFDRIFRGVLMLIEEGLNAARQLELEHEAIAEGSSYSKNFDRLTN